MILYTMSGQWAGTHGPQKGRIEGAPWARCARSEGALRAISGHAAGALRALWARTVFFGSLAARDILLKNVFLVPKHTKKLVAQ